METLISYLENVESQFGKMLEEFSGSERAVGADTG